jgi:hypothetical protein
MIRKTPCLAREKRTSLFVQSEKRSMQGKIRLLGFFRKQQYMRKQPILKKESGQQSRIIHQDKSED